MVVVGDAKALVEDKMARVQDALAVAEEARCNAEAEAALLEVERTSLLLEIGMAKDEVSSLHSQVGKDKEAMEEDYQNALELIFAYGYVCCVFKHNICGDHLEVPDGMLDSSNPLSPEFFVNPKCPPALVATKPQKLRWIRAKRLRSLRGELPLRIKADPCLSFFSLFFF